MGKKCFFVAPIGEPEDKRRERSDALLAKLVQPVANVCGYDVVRGDRIPGPGYVRRQMLEHIVGDELVVADVSEINGNVFYELGLRHACGKGVIQIAEHGVDIPFDIRDMRTVYFTMEGERGLARAKAELEREIRAIEERTLIVRSPLAEVGGLTLSREWELAGNVIPKIVFPEIILRHCMRGFRRFMES